MKDDRYKVEQAVKFKFSYLARESPYQMTCTGYLPSQDQWIHSDEIDEEVKFRFWLEEDLKPTFRRGWCHGGRTGPERRSETLSGI